jgi:two-component system cell cycle response regulator
MEAAMAQLILELDDKKKSYKLAGEFTLLGRSDECDIPVIGSIDISRDHCGIRKREDGTYVVKDLNSRNGTFVNDVPADKETKIHNGDILRLGKQATYRFSDKAEREADEKLSTKLFDDTVDSLNIALETQDYGRLIQDIVKQTRKRGPRSNSGDG